MRSFNKKIFGGSAIPGTSLGVNARLVGTNDCVPLPTWDGTLTQ